ncbi:MAG: GNAT family N-acetyltransferase [Burkholderiales bacterium]
MALLKTAAHAIDDRVMAKSTTTPTAAVTAMPSLRPSRESDGEFFYGVLKQTMLQFIVQTWGAWDDSRVQQEALEFGASCDGQVIEVDGSRVGILLTRQASDHVYVRLLCIAPEFQRRGIGSLVVNALASRAAVQGQSLRLRVMACNPARVFYDALGFEATEVTPQFVYMQRASQTVECSSSLPRITS